MNSKLRLFAAAALLAAGLPTGAYAQVTSPQTMNLTVSATVTSICQLSAPSNITFGSVQAGQTANAAGSVTVTCNKGAAVTASTLSLNASGVQKRMQLGSTGEYLNYTVWQPDLGNLTVCAGTPTDWNAAVTLTSLWTASGGPRPMAICATTTPSNTHTTGTYNDTLTVSVSFS